MWYWIRLLRVLRTARNSNQSILKEINPEYSLKGLLLKLKLQYFGLLMWRADSLQKILMLEKTEGKRRRKWQRMRWLDNVTNSMDMNLSELREIVKAQLAAVHGIAKSQTRLSDWRTTRSFQGGWMWPLLLLRLEQERESQWEEFVIRNLPQRQEEFVIRNLPQRHQLHDLELVTI